MDRELEPRKEREAPKVNSKEAGESGCKPRRFDFRVNTLYRIT